MRCFERLSPYRASACGVNANYERIVSWGGEHFRTGYPIISETFFTTVVASVLTTLPCPIVKNGLAQAEWYYTLAQHRGHSDRNDFSLGCLLLGLTNKHHFDWRRHTYRNINIYISLCVCVCVRVSLYIIIYVKKSQWSAPFTCRVGVTKNIIPFTTFQ